MKNRTRCTSPITAGPNRGKGCQLPAGHAGHHRSSAPKGSARGGAAAVSPAAPPVDLGSVAPALAQPAAAGSSQSEPQQSASEWLDSQLKMHADTATERVRKYRPLSKSEAGSILGEAAHAAMGTLDEFLNNESLHEELLAAIPPMSSAEEAEYELWGMLDEKLAGPMECEIDGVQVVHRGATPGIRVWVNGLATQNGVLGVDSPGRYECERANFGERVTSVNNQIDPMASYSLTLRFGVRGKQGEEDFVGYAVCGAYLPMEFPPDQFRLPGGSTPIPQ